MMTKKQAELCNLIRKTVYKNCPMESQAADIISALTIMTQVARDQNPERKILQAIQFLRDAGLQA